MVDRTTLVREDAGREPGKEALPLVCWHLPDSDALVRLTEPGLYQLYLRLARPLRLEVGQLGAFDFPAGIYVYTGSALRGIGARVTRHLRAEKRCHWHIDYLRERAEVLAVATLTTQERLECTLHQRTMERLQGRVIVEGFGSSDCRCPSHLAYWSEHCAPLEAWIGI